jgi:hypothetical protein
MNDKKAWSWAGPGGGEDDLQLRGTQVAPHHQTLQPPATGEKIILNLIEKKSSFYNMCSMHKQRRSKKQTKNEIVKFCFHTMNKRTFLNVYLVRKN